MVHPVKGFKTLNFLGRTRETRFCNWISWNVVYFESDLTKGSESLKISLCGLVDDDDDSLLRTTRANELKPISPLQDWFLRKKDAVNHLLKCVERIPMNRPCPLKHLSLNVFKSRFFPNTTTPFVFSGPIIGSLWSGSNHSMPGWFVDNYSTAKTEKEA